MNKTKKVTMQSAVVATPERAYLKAERVQDSLRRLPGWELKPDGKGIVRSRSFADSTVARAFVNRVCRLAAGVHQPVNLSLAGAKVVVTLQGHPARGCTGGLGRPVFDLANLIG